MTRILFLGDTAGTGFGTVTRDLASALVERGEDVRILSMNEAASGTVDKGFPVILRDRVVTLGHRDGWLALEAMTPTGQNARDTLTRKARGVFAGTTVKGWKPQAVIIVGDIASLKMSPWPDLVPPDLPTWHYVPIEGIGLPPRWGEFWTRFRPVAMTEFGAEQISKVTHTIPPVVYHGVDPNAFWPVSGKRPLVMTMGKDIVTMRSRAECRAFLGWPKDETILFRADRHMPRKNYAALMRGVAPVLARHGDARLIWHCHTIDQGGDLRDERSHYPAFIGDRMNSTGLHDQFGGVDRKVLCAMYNAADLYVTSSAEGFGLTIAEALACGTPVVGLDYSSVPEVVGPAGIVVPVTLQDNIYSHFWALPKQVEFEGAIEAMVADPTMRRALGALGPGHVARFTWNDAARRFSALIRGEDPGPLPSSKPSPSSLVLA